MWSNQLPRAKRWVHHPHETRLEAVRRVDAGEKVELVAEEFGVTCETVYAWRRAAKAAGGSPPPPRPPGRRPRTAKEQLDLKRDLYLYLARSSASERTLSALAAWFEQRSGRPYSEVTVRRQLWRLGCSFSRDEIGGQRTWNVDPAELRSVLMEAGNEQQGFPQWFNDGRQRRIMKLLRHATSTASALKLTEVLERMPTMKADMKAAGATDNDLRIALEKLGITEAPATGALTVNE